MICPKCKIREINSTAGFCWWCEQVGITNKILGTENQREKIFTDLMKIADDGEYEDMRREIIRYFNK